MADKVPLPDANSGARKSIPKQRIGCKICGKDLQKKNLLQHIIGVNEEKKLSRCTICRQEFN